MTQTDNKQGKRWCFTNYDLTCDPELKNATYVYWQLEECPTTHRQHHQGFVVFPTNQRYKAVQKWLGNPSLHVERMVGSIEQNEEYCGKTKTRVLGPWTLGERPTTRQGQRTDLQEVATMVSSGRSLREIAEAHPVTFVKFHRGISSLQYTLSLKREMRPLMEVELHWGATRTGKTRQAWERYPELYPWGGQWWFDGYQGEQTILLDDFYGGIKLSDLLKVLEHYPLQVPVKGGYVAARWVRVIITSNVHWHKWYQEFQNPDMLELKNALQERFTSVTHYPSITRRTSGTPEHV